MTNNPRYTLGTEANRIFMASETYELLKFGKGFPAPDGGSGWLNADGTLDPSHGVETWITSRMAHVYSIGAMLGYPGAGELADAALRGLTGILHDDEHGGWYPPGVRGRHPCSGQGLLCACLRDTRRILCPAGRTSGCQGTA